MNQILRATAAMACVASISAAVGNSDEHPNREVGIWRYGFVLARGSGLALADTVERAFVITSQAFGYCWSRDRANRLVEDATPAIRQRLLSAFGERVSVAEIRVMVHSTAAEAREDRAAVRVGGGRLMDILLPVVDDKTSCLPPRHPGE